MKSPAICMRSDEMYGFPLALLLSLQSHKLSTCCFVKAFFRVSGGGAENPYISFDLMQNRAFSGKTARRPTAAAPERARGGKHLRIPAPPYICHSSR